MELMRINVDHDGSDNLPLQLQTESQEGALHWFSYIVLPNNSADRVPFRLLALPDEYIKIIPHPHSLDTAPKIIPITLSPTNHCSYSSPKSSTQLFAPLSKAVPPWAPFNTLADFEYTETAIQGLLSKQLVNKQLAGIQGSWAVKSSLTLRTYNDMEAALTRARRHYVQVMTLTI